MKLTGVVAEYNPFHNGHAYQLAQAKARTGADAVAVVMSGDFVQRGEPACIDKFSRAEAALRCGADLVLELPVRFAVSSAEFFAEGAVSVLDGIRAQALCFGCETRDAAMLTRLAQLFLDEPEAFKADLRARLRAGESYPKARAQAAIACLALAPEGTCQNGFSLPPASGSASSCPAMPCDHRSKSASDLLASPNAILGIEYTKAILRLGSSMEIVPVLRTDKGYHSTMPGDSYASATAIRQMLVNDSISAPCPESSAAIPASDDSAPFHDPLADFIPAPALDILRRSLLADNGPAVLDDYSQLIRYRLLTLSMDELTSLPDVSEELARRIGRMLPGFISASAFAQAIKSRNLTLASVKRALLHAVLGIRREDVYESRRASFARVLGVHRSFLPRLGELQTQSAIPLLLRLSDADRTLDQTQLSQLEQELFASNVYRCRAGGSHLPDEKRRPLLVI